MLATLRKVFLDGFLCNRDGFQLEIPIVPLGELYGKRLESWLENQGVTVHLKTGIREIECDDDGSVCGVALRTGKSLDADLIVLAVPFDRVLRLVPEALRKKMPGLAGLDSLCASPIVGVHLWFDRSVCPYDHVVTLGRLIQWVFNHTAIQGRGATSSTRSPGTSSSERGSSPAREGQYLQLVISASHGLLADDKVAIRDAVLAELAEIWPTAKTATLLRWWVVVEHGATFSVRPGVDALRPSQRTAADGLFLAGDWTSTSWPATMEGAVRSGYLAAQEILKSLDQPTRFIRPGLKPSALARWLFGGTNLRPTEPSCSGAVAAGVR